nr:minichromosome maintenance complex component 3-like protein [Cryptomonas curvata]
MKLKTTLFKISVFKKYFTLFLKKYKLFCINIKQSRRIFFSLDSLWKFSPFLAQSLLKKPLIYVPIIENYLNEICNNFKYVNKIRIKFGFNLNKLINKKFSSPRFLSAKFLGEIVFLQGLVVNCSKKKVKLSQSVYFCPKSEKIFIKKKIKKIDKLLYFKKIRNAEGQRLELEYGLSKFTDYQNLVIQDLPEIINQNESPSKVNIILEDELVNSCKIGQKVKLCGIYQPLEFSESNTKTNFFSANIKCLSICLISDYFSLKYFKCDVILMKNFSLLVDSFDRLASLIAPNVFGKLLIKKGIILFLTGEPNNSIFRNYHIKENINILLIGDSCSHKTNLIRYVSNFFPNSVFITLTSNYFNELSNRIKNMIHSNTNNLNHFYISMPDNPIFCVDGLENISEFDKYLLNNFLGYQDIYIPTESLIFNSKTKSRLIATANSIFGNYDSKKSIYSNVNLEKSFLSKFDLIFLLLDYIDIQKDKKLANYLINHNQYSTHKKYNISKKKKAKSFTEIENFSIDFLKIYISFSKNFCKPKLEDNTINYILENYVKIRILKKTKRDFKINYIETLIRLTMLYVKINLRLTVKKEDVDYINDYLIEITKNNTNNESTIIQKSTKFTHIKNYELSLNKQHSFLLKPKTDIICVINNKINILKKLLPLSGIISTVDFQFSFFNVKKTLLNKQKNSCFERTISEWLKSEKCLIFKKILIRI